MYNTVHVHTYTCTCSYMYIITCTCSYIHSDCSLPATLSSASLPSSEYRPNSSESNVDILGVRTI